MGFNPATFLKNLDRIITSGGFKKSIEVPLHSVCLFSDSSPLTTTTSTNPGFAAIETYFPVLTWAAGKVVKAGITFAIPDDYDASDDYLRIKIKACMAGATDTTTALDATVYADDAASTDLDPTISADLSSTLAWVEINCDSQDLEPGDVIAIGLFPETHATDAVEVYAIKIEYKSDLVYYTASSR